MRPICQSQTAADALAASTGSGRAGGLAPAPALAPGPTVITWDRWSVPSRRTVIMATLAAAATAVLGALPSIVN